MTKTSKSASLSTEVVTPAEPVTVTPEMTPTRSTLLPPTLRLFGPTLTTLAQIVVHARLGYVLDMNAPVDQFGAAGTTSLYMRLGTPDDGIVKLAQTTVQEAAAQYQVQYARDVQEAARQLLEDEARAKREAEVAARIKETEAQIAALQASLKQ